MKPLHIISHVACSRPGYLCRYLDQHAIRYQRIDIESGDPLPTASNSAGVILLGAPVSVNSGAAWIEQEMELVQACHEQGIPVFGICFGAQLISRALGGTVRAAPSMQIGWHPVQLTPQGEQLFHGFQFPSRFEALEWHEETFSLPAGATPLFRGGCIEQQGFQHGSCLAVQFHPEVSESMVREWVARYRECTDRSTQCIQPHEEILQGLTQRLESMRRMSDRLFHWWLQGQYQRKQTKSG